MNESMDRVLGDWLLEGPEHGPRDGLERALAATRRSTQRPGWSFPERWLPMQLSLARTPSMRPLLAIATVALLILALGAAAILIGSAQRQVPPPFGVARNGAVVFEAGGDLHIADTLEGTSRLLVGGPDREVAPVFSNQGDRVALIRELDDGQRLMSIRADGTGLTTLGDFPSIDGVRWSPDGTTLLVNYTESGPAGLRLAVVQADGSGSRELDIDTAPDWASWRPGTGQLAFRGQVSDGRALRTDAAAFMADADGTNVRRLAIETSDSLDLEGLSWSPDGTRLSFMTGHETGWRIGIADVDAAGSLTAVHRLEFDPQSTDEMLPDWSPDSSRFAFILGKGGVYQIAIGDGSGAFRLVGPRTAERNGFDYGWTPDGQRLLIAVRLSLWSVDPASGVASEVHGPTTRIPAFQRLAP